MLRLWRSCVLAKKQASETGRFHDAALTFPSFLCCLGVMLFVVLNDFSDYSYIRTENYLRKKLTKVHGSLCEKTVKFVVSYLFGSKTTI